MKRRMIKRIAAITALVLITMNNVSTDASQTTNETAKQSVYKTVSGRYFNLNPHNCVDTHDVALVNLIAECITGTVYDNELNSWKFIPVQAADFPETKDNRVWTITLKDGLKFSDTSEIDAYAYIESWKRLLDPKLKNHNAKLLLDSIDIKGARKFYNGEAEWKDVEISAKDKKTIVITLDTPAHEVEIYDVFSKPFMSPVKADLYDSFLNDDKTETKYGMVSNQIVSNGAYKIERLIRDKECILIKNENSVLSQYKTLDRLEFTVSDNLDENLSAFKSGEIDSLPVTNSIHRDGIDGIPSIKSIGGSVWGISVNHESKKNIMSSKEFRKVLMSSIDRDAIVEKYFKSFRPVNYLISGTYIVGDVINGNGISYRETEHGKLVASKNFYDAEFAKVLFDEAIELSEENEQILLTMAYPDGQALMRDLAIMIKKEIENFFEEGLVTVKLIPAAEIDRVTEWDMRIESLSGSTSNPWAILSRFEHVYDEEFLNDLNNAYSMDNAERIELLSEMEKAVADSAMFIPLFQNDGAFIWSERIVLPTGEFIPGFGFGITQAKVE